MFILVPVILFSQTKEPWEIDCGKMNTQLDMNVCSYESFKIADSVLLICYKDLLNYLDSSLLAERAFIQDNTDTIQMGFVQQLEEQIEYVNKSQIDFQTLRSSTTEIVKLQFEGGSMKPLMVNIYVLELTVNQIKLLRSITDLMK